MARFLHAMCRITDPEKSRAFYEALGFAFAADFDIVGNSELEATNYFSVEDLDGTLERLAAHGIEPERPPYTVREAARGCAPSKTRRGSSSS